VLGRKQDGSVAASALVPKEQRHWGARWQPMHAPEAVDGVLITTNGEGVVLLGRGAQGRVGSAFRPERTAFASDRWRPVAVGVAEARFGARGVDGNLRVLGRKQDGSVAASALVPHPQRHWGARWQPMHAPEAVDGVLVTSSGGVVLALARGSRVASRAMRPPAAPAARELEFRGRPVTTVVAGRCGGRVTVVGRSPDGTVKATTDTT
jgi:hypothetical protein